MSHEIEVVNGVAKMFYAGEAPWHGLGTQVAEAVTSEEAIVLAGLDTEVALGPVYGGPTRKAIQRIAGKFCIYREQDGQVFGVVTARYQPFQNREAFVFLDSLVQDGVMRYEAAGSLYSGRQVWMLAKMTEGMEINGEGYQPYVCLTTGHDGLNAVRILPTTVRVICNNTLRWALGSDERNVKIRVTHSPSMFQKLASAREVLEVTTEAQRRLREFLEMAAEYEVGDLGYKQVTEGLFGPLDEAPKGQRAKAIEAFRAIYDAEVALNGANAYSLVNTVTGFADHSRHYKGTEEQRAERRFQSVLSTWGGAFQFKQRGLALVQTAINEAGS